MQELVAGTIGLAQAMLGWLGTPFEREGELLRHASGFAAQVDVSCTALAPALMLALALVVAGALRRLPAPHLAAALVLGVVVIAAINQLRLVAVLWVGAWAPAHFGWVHTAAGPLALVAAGTALVFAVLAQPAAVRSGHDGVR